MTDDKNLRSAFDSLADKIKSDAGGRQIVYISNPGNFGDGLIRLGTKHFLADYEIDHVEATIGYHRPSLYLLRYLLKAKNFHFLYGGGGAWSNAYPFGRDTCKTISRFGGHITVLPTTFALEGLPEKASLVRRDNLDSLKFAPQSAFCHDMALYLAVKSKEGRFRTFDAPVKDVGVHMRTDHESKNLNLTNLPGNEDLSIEGDHMSDAHVFLERIAETKLIYTDRLHVAIGACIIGREVRIYPGNYFKIPAVFNTSLEPYFGNSVQLLPADWDFSILSHRSPTDMPETTGLVSDV